MAKGKKATKRSSRRVSRSHRGSSKSKNIPLLPSLGVVNGLGLPALRGWNMSSGKPATERLSTALDQLGQSVYGYSSINQKWYAGNLPRFWAPVGGTAIAHIILNKLGVNRILARHKMGFTL